VIVRADCFQSRLAATYSKRETDTGFQQLMVVLECWLTDLDPTATVYLL